MFIEVKSVECEVMDEYIVPSTGAKVARSAQSAFLHSDGQIIRFRIVHWRTDKPFAPGRYTLSERVFSVGKYGDIELARGRLPLVPAGVTQGVKAG